MNNREIVHFVLTQNLHNRGIIRYPSAEEIDEFLLMIENHPQLKNLEAELLKINREVQELEHQRRELLQREAELYKQFQKGINSNET